MHTASVVFSRDGTRVLTCFTNTDHFAVWSVPDGQLVAVNRGDPDGVCYFSADVGVPGSASDGLVGFGSNLTDVLAVDLWDVSPSVKGPSQARLRGRFILPPEEVPEDEDPVCIICLAFSPDGSKFVAGVGGVVFVCDVASLARLGAYTSPSDCVWAQAAWQPDGRHVRVSWHDRGDFNEGKRNECMCVWDFSSPEAPPVLTFNVGPDALLEGGFPPCGDATYVVMRRRRGPTRNGPVAFTLQERRAADRSILRLALVGFYSFDSGAFPQADRSPDGRALLLRPFESSPARVVLFE